MRHYTDVSNFPYIYSICHIKYLFLYRFPAYRQAGLKGCPSLFSGDELQMKKILGLSFGILGFSSLISQVVVIRELAMSFYGNEFFIGWVLFCWLLGTSLGSILGSKLSRDPPRAFRSLAICHVLIAILFPMTIVLIRSGKPILGTSAGAMPEFILSLLYSLAVLVPLCGVMGMQFAVAARGGSVWDSSRAGSFSVSCWFLPMNSGSRRSLRL